MYTIGQISEMFKFGEGEIEALRVIECLKASGLEIKDIKLFMRWTTEGSATYPQRRQLFETRKAAVEKEINGLQKTLDMLRYKCWYYETAIRDGNEDRINEMLPDGLPPEVRKWYDSAHA